MSEHKQSEPRLSISPLANLSASDPFSRAGRAHELALQVKKTNKNGVPYSYGTSGFRGPHEILPSVTLRMGMLAALRSMTVGAKIADFLASRAGVALKPANEGADGLAIGVQVTASHNEEHDNGIKLVDPTGEMMDTAWEDTATALANAPEDQVVDLLKQIAQDKKVDWRLRPKVFVGRDTRASSPELAQLVINGALAIGATVLDYGVVTTPQLHYVTRDRDDAKSEKSYFLPDLSRALKVPALLLDCANGVGGIAFKDMVPFFEKQNLAFDVQIRNAGDSLLNDNAGAEHVHKTHTLPRNFDAAKDKGAKCASFDGDADRVVYYYINDQGQLKLLDGDKIISLYTLFIQDLIKASGIDLKIGIVQTAYANGASTLYLKEKLKIPVEFTPTGVKWLHHKATEFDIGIYFESNGHGTVLFSLKAIKAINLQADNDKATETQQKATRALGSLIELVNQGVGDAISDLLLVEVALYHRKWTLQDWDAIYQDLPSSNKKVKVKDRSIIKTTDAERRCTAPGGLQEAIDELIAAAPNAAAAKLRRAFVRPSGTEDIVRVYAEAGTQEECDALAEQVCKAVMTHAGGIQ